MLTTILALHTLPLGRRCTRAHRLPPALLQQPDGDRAAVAEAIEVAMDVGVAVTVAIMSALAQVVAGVAATIGIERKREARCSGGCKTARQSIAAPTAWRLDLA